MIVFLVVALAGGILFYALIFAGSSKTTRSTNGRGGGRNKYPATQLGDIKGRWEIIKATAEGGAAGMKSAISEADKLFDGVLRAQGLPGDTMADRLKAAKPRFSSYSVYDGVWRAHKVRNSLAHDVGFDLVPLQAREALADFERGLRDLGAF